MVGNIEDARKALNGELTKVGKGASRYGYVDADKKTVYKVEHSYLGINQVEYDTMTELRELGCPFIPEISLYKIGGKVVTAVPFFEKTAYDYDPKVEGEFWGTVGYVIEDGDLTWDCGGSNLRVDKDGNLYITDLQYMSDYNRLGKW